MNLWFRQEEELGMYEAPVEEWIAHAEAMERDYPHDKWNGELLAWLRSLDHASDMPIAVSEKRSPRLLWFAADLIAQGVGSVWCPLCGRTYPAAEVQVEEWEQVSGPLCGGGGREVACSRGHRMLRTMDWRA